MIGVLESPGHGQPFAAKDVRDPLLVHHPQGNVLGQPFRRGLSACLQHCTGLVRLDQAGYFLTTVPIFIDWGWWALLNLITFAFIVSLLALPTMIISLILPEKSIRFE
ncbi:MAG: hypothetical protein ACLTZY_05185 [Alistipes indistinctus]